MRRSHVGRTQRRNAHLQRYLQGHEAIVAFRISGQAGARKILCFLFLFAADPESNDRFLTLV